MSPARKRALAALALLCLAALWLVTADSPPPAPPDPPAIPSPAAPSDPPAIPSPAAPSAPASTPPLALAAPPDTPPTAAAPQPAPLTANTRTPLDPRAEELARAHWVEGRVLFPPGTPRDERATVTARGDDFEHGPHHSAAVAPDGSFRVAFARDTRTGRFELEARYLILPLPKSPRWGRGASTEPILLEPVLGARLAGRVLPPAGARLADCAGTVELWRTAGKPWREAPIDAIDAGDAGGAGGAFAFDALPGDATWRLTFTGEQAGALGPFELEPGRTTEVELALVPGIVVEGRAVDERGRPVAGAEIRARVEGSDHPRDVREVVAESDGAFRIGGLSAGNVRLTGEHPDHRDGALALGELEPGERAGDVELVLAVGGVVAGRVLLPDGSPAGAGVEVAVDDGGGRERRATDERGAFRFGGLGDGPVRVEARCERPLAAADGEEARAVPLGAALDDVAPDGRPVELVLRECAHVAGRVVDERGAPVESFRVTVRRDGTLVAKERFRDAAGRFRVDGLLPGTFEVGAESAGHGADDADVELPGAADVELVLPRFATVAGRVHRPDGSAAGDAEVKALVRVTELEETSVLASKSVRDGAFELEVPAMPVELVAEEKGFIASEPLALDLVPGGAVRGLDLVLRRRARVWGEVVDADGEPLRDVSVWVQEPSMGRPAGSATSPLARQCTDAAGAFALEDLPVRPLDLVGRVAVGGLELRAHLGELRPGESRRVRLALPSGPLVRVHGTVRCGDAPGWLRMSARRDLGDGRSLVASARVEDSGAYELRLPGGGPADLALDGEAAWSAAVDLPAAGELRVDVEVPTGLLVGNVVGRDGRPVADAGVWISAGESLGAWRELPRGGGGDFAVRLPAGTYSVAPQVAGSGRMSTLGQRTERVVVREGETTVAPDLVVE